MEYQTQKYKLLPLLAAAYAYKFTADNLMTDYIRLKEEIRNGQVEALPEVNQSHVGFVLKMDSGIQMNISSSDQSSVLSSVHFSSFLCHLNKIVNLK